MISYVKIINYIGLEIIMELEFPERSGFAIFNMTGLGPEKSEIQITEMSTANGGVFTSARLPSRNIVMSLRYWKWLDKTVEFVRHESYKYFPIMKPITLIIQTENRRGVIKGYVEANSPVIFSKETHAQLSIICPDPFFYSEDIMVTTFDAVEPMFEFPFSNESLTEPLLIMGEIWPEAYRSVYYEGDAEIGVTIHIIATGPVTKFKIFDPENERSMSINDDRLIALTGAGIGEGDHIVISTVKGDKRITLTRGPNTYNILNALNRDAFLFQLHKGDNLFAYSAEFGLEAIIFRIENRVAYEGV